MKMLRTDRLPILVWGDDMDEPTLEQATRLASHPYTVGHISGMPDHHPGYGMFIGGVAVFAGVVVPEAVGFDIGCGMRACRTTLTDISQENKIKVLEHIRSEIPVGVNCNRPEARPELMIKWGGPLPEVVESEFDHTAKQVGTLGSGNHFIELQKGSDGFLWLMVHSGSRHLGNVVAKHYIELAKEYVASSDVYVPPHWELDYLPVTSDAGQSYLTEMYYCMMFAKQNRAVMMDAMVSGLKESTGCEIDLQYDAHHNYAAREDHLGRMLWTHRKGATSAQKGQIGIIPGSQGTLSYITEGRGNEQSFSSSSHGSGRVMGRNEARKNLNLVSEKKKLDDLGIMHSIRSAQDLDEAPGAYKDPVAVMQAQLDLVKPLVELRPIAVIKG